MGMGTFLIGLRIIGQVAAWSDKALADGKITIVEAVELAQIIGETLGVRLELDFSLPLAPPIPHEADAPAPGEEEKAKETEPPQGQ